MRVVLLAANHGRWTAKGAAPNTENGVEAWIYAFEGDYISYDEVRPKEFSNMISLLQIQTMLGLIIY